MKIITALHSVKEDTKDLRWSYRFKISCIDASAILLVSSTYRRMSLRGLKYTLRSNFQLLVKNNSILMSQDHEQLRAPAILELIDERHHISAGEATEKQPRRVLILLKQLPEREKPLLERQKRVAKRQATARKRRANKLGGKSSGETNGHRFFLQSS